MPCVGTRVKGVLQQLDAPTILNLNLKKGQVYEVHIETEGIPNPQEAINLLLTKTPEKFPELAIIWISANEKTIRLQIIETASPIVWSSIFTFLPTILALIGISAVLISIYNVISAVPTWAWAVLAVGVLLIIFGPAIAKAITPPRYAPPAVMPIAYRYEKS